jgi:TonB family protein
MRFIIDAKGNVQDASVVRSTDPDFSAAALEAVKQWKYSPARKSGQPVNIAVQMPVVFNLADD